MTASSVSFLATRRGRLTLLLLCTVQFLDVADSSIMNIALPSIRRDLGFSVQNLQWVLSGYLVTYRGLAAQAPPAAALTGGFQRALLTCAIFLLAAAVIALRATNTHGEPTADAHSPAGHDRIPTPEMTDGNPHPRDYAGQAPGPKTRPQATAPEPPHRARPRP